ncbi:MAG: hypothetical protein MHM6MM_004601 [Cercozoa sp. M6MM]
MSFDEQQTHTSAHGTNEVLLEEYRRESAFLRSNFSCENFVAAFDIVEDSFGAMLLLRLCSFDSLPNFVSALHERFETEKLQSMLEHIVRQMNDALRAMHLRGYIHGDVKPSNFVVDESLNVKLCDFGSVHFADRETLQTTPFSTFGTPLYASPEMLALRNGGDAARAHLGDSGFAIDMWSLGMSVADLTRCLPSFVTSADISDSPELAQQSQLPTIWESEEERIRLRLVESLLQHVNWRFDPMAEARPTLTRTACNSTISGTKSTADSDSIDVSESSVLQFRALSQRLAFVLRACLSVKPSSRANTQEVEELLTGKRQFADLSLSRSSSADPGSSSF